MPTQRIQMISNAIFHFDVTSRVCHITTHFHTIVVVYIGCSNPVRHILWIFQAFRLIRMVRLLDFQQTSTGYLVSLAGSMNPHRQFPIRHYCFINVRNFCGSSWHT